MNALACGVCGAGLPPPDFTGTSSCMYCGTEHHERSSEVIAAGLSHRSVEPPRSSGVIAAERPSWHDGEDAARIPMTEEAVLDLVRQHFGDADSVFVCPHVPPKREQASRRAHIAHLPARERILALYDATRFGVGDEGFVVTAKRLCWKNAGGLACSILWRDIDPDRLYADTERLFIGDDAIAIGGDGVTDVCANAFHVLALSGHWWGPDLAASPSPQLGWPLEQAASEYVPAHVAISEAPTTPPMQPMQPLLAPPPQAHGTSYQAYASGAETPPPDCCCWHCRTPLYDSTPQCARCGALRKKRGWLRAG